MGLRFRKSVTLCKGVKLNFGKTGMSVSAGVPGFRKTINTKGQVTTSVGIPGTGIYYTDTKRINGNNKYTTGNNSNYSYSERSYQGSYEDFTINDSVENYLNLHERESEQAVQPIVHEVYEENPAKQDIIDNKTVQRYLTENDIKHIYEKCDETVDWTELIVSSSADDMYMDENNWKFLKSISKKILSGNIDTYLEAIEKMRPVDDLLDYGSEFEFGTDDPNTMEVEFRVNKEILPKKEDIGSGKYRQLFYKYICSSSIRVARDIFALLPVKYVIVKAVDENNELINVRFAKEIMSKINFKKECSMEIVEKFL